LAGVLLGTHISPHLVDAVIGLSVVYKALDNLGLYRRWLGVQPNTKVAVLLFGFVHGFGLATKLQDFTLSPDGLVANLLAFNLGVEIGQLLRSEEHTSELQSRENLVCRLLLEKKNEK